MCECHGQAVGGGDGTGRSVRKGFPQVNSDALLVVYYVLRCFLVPTCNQPLWPDQNATLPPDRAWNIVGA